MFFKLSHINILFYNQQTNLQIKIGKFDAH